MTGDPNDQPIVLRENLRRHRVVFWSAGFLAVLIGLTGFIIVIMGGRRLALGTLLVVGFFALRTNGASKELRARKCLTLTPDGIEFSEVVEGVAMVRRKAWEDIGYIDVISGGFGYTESVIYWAPATPKGRKTPRTKTTILNFANARSSAIG
jgi:hypothetical protein